MTNEVVAFSHCKGVDDCVGVLSSGGCRFDPSPRIWAEFFTAVLNVTDQTYCQKKLLPTEPHVCEAIYAPDSSMKP